ncbi:bifunctional 2-polyprenyl-6-hydroxyphenol methylase/3-demethylubiquinol 3-O-methyltransferase UbiG [Neiella marina]|uniref:Ubiquinone biosynthesis O-methyltransferase n=1 Tax=Neiella holothuriorum TaxID=2870530 RepID=A0ABS7EK84_9GAMM|nr:bifunctional 2-polyprenyl-6-hydroxyphenol methylase/3-demethylubiquinol 3-O-methyltransferase UbiG [Neiella holothuriorum]MBW8192635.1 bifunctional 2-polyprenyl-6-hydroxyphenol methylase/3-demethylubiquinol 3-O-methyltransferase UbiG [Neiella holothuriorum]
MLDKSTLTSSTPSHRQAHEIAKFDQLAEEWRNDNGRFKHISAFNRCRVRCIVERIIDHFQLQSASDKPLAGFNILDVGCGAGLICEALAALGATVTGIDGSETNIEVAKRNASANKLSIDYQHALAEHMLTTRKSACFDVVLNTEVIEHVDDQQTLTNTCASLTHSNGLLVMATLNRTLKSFFVAIIGAEYLLNMLPKGTHDWRWFVRPSQLEQWLQPHQFSTTQLVGLSYNLVTKNWRITDDSSVNYLLFASRQQ